MPRGEAVPWRRYRGDDNAKCAMPPSLTSEPGLYDSGPVYAEDREAPTGVAKVEAGAVAFKRSDAWLELRSPRPSRPLKSLPSPLLLQVRMEGGRRGLVGLDVRDAPLPGGSNRPPAAGEARNRRVCAGPGATGARAPPRRRLKRLRERAALAGRGNVPPRTLRSRDAGAGDEKFVEGVEHGGQHVVTAAAGAAGAADDDDIVAGPSQLGTRRDVVVVDRRDLG